MIAFHWYIVRQLSMEDSGERHCPNRHTAPCRVLNRWAIPTKPASRTWRGRALPRRARFVLALVRPVRNVGGLLRWHTRRNRCCSHASRRLRTQSLVRARVAAHPWQCSGLSRVEGRGRGPSDRGATRPVGRGPHLGTTPPLRAS